MSTKFTSFVLDNIKCPINILQEFLRTFPRSQKCKAAILSWFDGRHFYHQNWIRVTYEELAGHLGYCRETISKHMRELIDDGLLLDDWSDEFVKDTARVYCLNSVRVAELVASRVEEKGKISRTRIPRRCEKTDIFMRKDSPISVNNSATYINDFQTNLNNQQHTAAEIKNSLEENPEEIQLELSALVKSTEEPINQATPINLQEEELTSKNVGDVDWDAIALKTNEELARSLVSESETELPEIKSADPELNQVDLSPTLDPQEGSSSIVPAPVKKTKQVAITREARRAESSVPQTSLLDVNSLEFRSAIAELKNLKCGFKLNAEIQRSVAKHFHNFAGAIAYIKKQIADNKPPTVSYEAWFVSALQKGLRLDQNCVPTNFGKWYDWAYKQHYVQQSELRSDGVTGICLREEVAASFGVNQWMRFEQAVELLGLPE